MVLPIIRYLRRHPRALLLRLPRLDPLLRRKMLAQLRERIRGKAQAVEQWAVLDRIQHNVVVGPRKVQHPQTVNVRLVRRRRVHAVYARLDQPARQRRQGVARVDRDRPVLRLHPPPPTRRVLDLQRGDRLSE